MSTSTDESELGIAPSIFRMSPIDDFPGMEIYKKICPSLFLDDDVILNLSEKQIHELGPWTQEFIRWYILEKKKGLRWISITGKPSMNDVDQESLYKEYLDMHTAPDVPDPDFF